MEAMCDGSGRLEQYENELHGTLNVFNSLFFITR